MAAQPIKLKIKIKKLKIKIEFFDFLFRIFNFSYVYLSKRAKGIEPSYPAWEADVLPMNYARKKYYTRKLSSTIFMEQNSLHIVQTSSIWGLEPLR